MNSLTIIIIKIVKGYQFIISPLLGNSCRYLPTCSEYCIDALKTYGIFKGLLISVKRILTCHPIKILGGRDGYDPLIKKVKIKK